jgi:NTE family protein
MRAIVCSGGGNRGAAQAGALEVLFGAGVVPDLLVGTSVGAINAAFLAAAPTPERARHLVGIWKGLRSRDVFPTAPRRQLVHLALGSDHVCSPDGLRALLEHHLGYHEIEDAAVPLVIVAADLSTGLERRLCRGPVVDAVLASAAMPGIFPPVRWGTDLLVDGGVVANVPLSAAVDAGSDEVWVLDTSRLCEERHPPRSTIDVALQGLAVQSTARAQAELACLPPGVTVRHLVLPCTRHRWYSDVSGSAELIAIGAAAAFDALDAAAFVPAGKGEGVGAAIRGR